MCLEGNLVGTSSCDCVAANREKGALIATEILTEYLLSERYYMLERRTLFCKNMLRKKYIRNINIVVIITEISIFCHV